MVTSVAAVVAMVALVADNKLASPLAAGQVSRLKLLHLNAVRHHELVLARQPVADRHWEAKRLPMLTNKDVAAVSARPHTRPS
jgi:hypothetical protein